jgi:hypothetical protein
MNKALDVAIALKALIAAALPGAEVIGLDGGDAAPARIGPNGRVTVELGNPGTPEIDLSPLTYNYAHQIAATFEAPASDTQTGAEVIVSMLAAVSTAVVANRFLGGAVDFLDATAPDNFDDETDGAVVIRVAPAVFTAIYSTSQPL